jgi:hypothetical protein
MAAAHASIGTRRSGRPGVPSTHKEVVMTQGAMHPVEDRTDESTEPEEAEEPGLVSGRPSEDRGFEVVETGVGVAFGVAIGTAVAGPIGAAVGGVVGAAAGFMVGEASERAAGRAVATTDASEPEDDDKD